VEVVAAAHKGIKTRTTEVLLFTCQILISAGEIKSILPISSKEKIVNEKMEDSY